MEKEEYVQYMYDLFQYCVHDCDKDCQGYGSNGECPWNYDNREIWLGEDLKHYD